MSTGNVAYAPVRNWRSIWMHLALGLAFICPHVRAADICVLAGDYLGLQAALDTAANNNEDDLVMLQSGQYYVPTNSGISYSPTDQHDVTIAGGYAELNGDPCGGIMSNDARQTVLNGGTWIRLDLPDGSGSITLKTLTITGVFDPNSSYPIRIRDYANSVGQVRISNAVFAGNVSLGESTIYIALNTSVLIENSLFYGNATFSGWPTIEIVLNRPDNGLCVGIVHSTFTQNTSAAPNVYIYSSTCGTLLANDIFWGNAGGDLQLSTTTAYAWNVDITDLDELAGASTSEVMSQDPIFNVDFSLNDFSPLRDAGLVGGFVFENGSYDVVGNPRTYGAKPDIGAFETQDVIFAHPFDW